MKIIVKYIAGFVISFQLLTSCTKDFAELNTDPSVVTQPDIKFLLSYSQEKLITYQGGEWVWESMEQLFRYTQHASASPFEISDNVNGRYGAFYKDILPNLFEIRRQIDAMPDAAAYQQMKAITYIMQVLQGIKVTDMNGSIPYTDALKGRYEANFSPLFDKQDALFDTWLGELDQAIGILSANDPGQQSYGTADTYYKGDPIKWVNLANTLKLRIAARIDNQDASKAGEIFRQVIQHPLGPIATDEAQLSYVHPTYSPFGGGGDINYRSPRYASTSVIRFLKAADDPRLSIFFEPNDLVGSFRDTLAKYNATLPSFIDPADPLIRFQGAPADWSTNATVAAFISNPFTAGNNNANNSISSYFLISRLNRLFYSPRFNGALGQFTEVPVSNAESCLLIAEFIQKGYGSGADTKGSAEDWYKKGIASSIRTMNTIAVNALSTTAFTGDGTTLINAYLDGSNVKFNGDNNLERIYIQQYLNFYRNAPEAFVLVRRTGYPKNSSAYYAREPYTQQIPRRWWINDPGEVNRANWSAALAEQGFTENLKDPATLSTQRIWYDKNAPAFGEGN